MTTLLLRGLAAILPVSPAVRARPAPARTAAAAHWMTPEIRRNMSARARRLIRSGD